MAKKSFESYRWKSLKNRWKDGEVTVEVWEERDRVFIGIQEVETGHYLAEWWDDDARQMFEDGFFDARDLENSVIKYAVDIKVPAYIKAKR